jgi:DNA-binding beta-propeller fold protein YncE
MLRYSWLIVWCLWLSVPLLAQELPTEVAFTKQGLRPEGVEWDAAAGHFLVGSLNEGSVYSVADDGTLTLLVEDDDLIASAGIQLDAAGGRVLVTNSEPTVFFNPFSNGMAFLGAYDLASGERLFYVDLGALTGDEGRHFANDIALDTEGNAYVTDSFSPIIYQVDVAGEATIFIQDDRLGSDFLGLNGIEYMPSEDGDYLLAAVGGVKKLYKIPLDDPQNLTPVEMAEEFSVDGMIRTPEGNLAVVANYEDSQAILLLTSDDDFATATISGRMVTDDYATTVTVRDGAVYYVNAYLNDFLRDEYEIVQAVFEAD